MKVLCVCERGNSRSVALAWILKDRLGQDAIAIGAKAASDETKKLLYDWAERIILVDSTLESEIPKKDRAKLKIWDVGPDRFFRGFDQELLDLFTKYINSQGI